MEKWITIKDKRVIDNVDQPDGRYLAKIEAKNKRTSPQNRYMHLMFSMIQKGFYDLGYREMKTADQAKSQMKQLFLKYEAENGFGGKIIMIKRTRDLTKEQMAVFIDECVQFAAENLSVVIPAPNEQTKMFAE